MNRDEALRLLKGGPEGVAEWNRRRVAEWKRFGSAGERIPSSDVEEIPALNGEHFEGDNLAGAILVMAILKEAHLQGAILKGAYLAGARLDRADLRGADLHGARLHGAYLGGADLRGAKLHGARLDGAKNLTQGQLESAQGDSETELPEGQGLVRPKSWEQTAESLQSRRMAVALWSVIVFAILALVVLFLICVGDKYSEVSGFMKSVVLALIAAAAAALFTQHREKSARESEVRSRREERVLQDRRSGAEALQKYLDSMTGLMLEENLQTLLGPGVEMERAELVREMARARTVAVSQGLDGVRRGTLLRFLYGSNLISKGKSVIQLRGADFLKANLFGADLHGADLSYIYLRSADLHEADLSGANLRRADLHGADLGLADLRGADLSWADLGEAYFGGADLHGVDLHGADLGEARTLTQQQLESARGDEQTKLPEGLVRPKSWIPSNVDPGGITPDNRGEAGQLLKSNNPKN